jgi:hypothetical protein
MRRLWALLFFGLVAVNGAAPARADGASPAEKLWLEQIARKLEAEGFEVRAARIEAGGYTLDVRYRDGASIRSANAADQKRWDRRLSARGPDLPTCLPGSLCRSRK